MRRHLASTLALAFALVFALLLLSDPATAVLRARHLGLESSAKQKPPKKTKHQKSHAYKPPKTELTEAGKAAATAETKRIEDKGGPPPKPGEGEEPKAPIPEDVPGADDPKASQGAAGDTEMAGGFFMDVKNRSMFQTDAYKDAIDDMGVRVPKMPSQRTAEDQERSEAFEKAHPNKYEAEDKKIEMAEARAAKDAMDAKANKEGRNGGTTWSNGARKVDKPTNNSTAEEKFDQFGESTAQDPDPSSRAVQGGQGSAAQRKAPGLTQAERTAEGALEAASARRGASTRTGLSDAAKLALVMAGNAAMARDAAVAGAAPARSGAAGGGRRPGETKPREVTHDCWVWGRCG